MIVTPFPDMPSVLRIAPKVHSDSRGQFFEQFHEERYAQIGLPGPWVQDNVSISKAGTLRGLHYQWPSHPQGKLVSVLRGTAWDVAVDIRVGSPTFAKWVSAELSDQNRTQLWIPPGFAHGFAALTDDLILSYKCTAPYSPDSDRSLAWNDPRLAIAWPSTRPHLSPKDASAPTLSDIQNEDLPFYLP